MTAKPGGHRRLGLIAASAVAIAWQVLLAAGPAAAAPPLAFSNATARQGTDGTVTITWTTTGSDPTLINFRVERTGSGPPTTLPLVGPTATSTTDPLTSLVTGVHPLIGYVVTAVGSGGDLTSITIQDQTIYKGVPGEPPTVDIVTHGATVDLAWQAPQVLPALVTGYRIERRVGTSGPYTVIEPSTTSRTLSDPVPGLTTPGVYEIDYIITSLSSGPDGGSTAPIANVFIGVPDFPATVAARMGFDGISAVVTWTPPAQNPAAVTGYRISRSIAGGPETVLGTVGNVLMFVDSTLGPVAAGDQVAYNITALSADGDGGVNTGFVTVEHTPLTVRAPILVPGNMLLHVSWSAPAIPPRGYRLRYRAVGSVPFTLVPEADINAATRTAVITGLTNNVTYEVELAAVDVVGAGRSAWSDPTRGTPFATPSVSPTPILPVTGASTELPTGAGIALVGIGGLLVLGARWRRLRG